MTSAIKRLRSFVRWFLGVVLVLYLATLALFSVPALRHAIAERASRELSDFFGTRVRVGDFHVGFPERLVLEDVSIDDRAGKPLLTAGRVAANMDWLSLAGEEIHLHSISLLDAKVSAYRTRPDTASNFQFFLDAFKGSEEGGPAPKVRVGSLILRRCNLRYDEHYQAETPLALNLSHIGLENLEASLSLKHFSEDSLNLRVRGLALSEKSGFEVKSLTLRLAANKQRAHLEGFNLRLPDTRIALPTTDFFYDLTAPSLLSTLRFETALREARLSTADLAPLLPLLQGENRSFGLTASLRKSSSRLRVDGLRITESSRDFLADADAELVFDEGKLDGLSSTLRQFHVSPSFAAWSAETFAATPLPDPISRLGSVSTHGALRLAHLSTDAARLEGEFQGRIETEAGSLDADLALRRSQLSGRVLTSDLALAKIADNASLPSLLTAEVRGSIDQLWASSPNFRASTDVKTLVHGASTLRDVHLEGERTGSALRALLSSRNPGADLDLTASASLSAAGGALRDIVAAANVRNLRPALLGLSGDMAESTYSGDINLSLSDASPLLQGKIKDIPSGALSLRHFAARGKKDFDLDSLTIRTAPSARGSRISMESDALSASLDGPVELQLLPRAATALLVRALPDFFPSQSEMTDGEWTVSARILKPDVLARLAGVDIDVAAPLELYGNLRADGGRSTLVATTSRLKYGGMTFGDVSLYLNSPDGNEISALAKAKKDDLALSLSARSLAGRLATDLSWTGDAGFPLTGSLHTLASSHQRGSGRGYLVEIQPSEVAVGDTLWDISAGRLTYEGGALDIEGLSLQHLEQGVTLDGRFSSNPSDSLVATLRGMEVAYILRLVDFDAVEFSGEASGRLSLAQRGGSPKVEADIVIPDFHFNGGPMGRLHLLGGFDGAEKRIDLDGHMRQEVDGGSTHARGYVSLKNQDINLDIHSEHTNLRCLRHYIGGILDDFEGSATGDLRLFGPLKKLDFEGDERITARARLPYTGVTYDVTDGHVTLSPGVIAFDSLRLSDFGRGTALAAGFLYHDHLKNLRYAFDATATNLLVYDKGRSDDLPFYSTAYGSGNIIFSGRPGSFDAEINMRAERGTTFTYIVDTPDSGGDASLVTFRDGRHLAASTDESRPVVISEPANSASTDIHLGMLFDVNPNASLRVVMDEKSGDVITLQGNGLLRANYYNKGSFQLFGTYRLTDGSYKMSIQDIIRKDFRFSEGGSIVFGGDPFEGDLDMQGVYTVNSASLSDLGIGTAFSQNSVRVNCLLNFSGKVKDPKVSFDLDLPTVNAEEKQMLLGIISTEEEMTTQVLYLLGIGRFYTNAGLQADAELTAGAQSSAAMKSFLSSTLSSQLNQIISDAVGSSNWSFGANVSTGSVGTNDMEIEGLLSGRLLNNRLLVNGNFGYRDNTYYSTNFIGDFDVRYLLTPGGTVSLKAYSETNDRYFSKSALTTQGAGIMLRRDFTTLGELFKPKKKKKERAPKKTSKKTSSK